MFEPNDYFHQETGVYKILRADIESGLGVTNLLKYRKYFVIAAALILLGLQ
jgi:hypothetical protein